MLDSANDNLGNIHLVRRTFHPSSIGQGGIIVAVVVGCQRESASLQFSILRHSFGRIVIARDAVVTSINSMIV